MRTKTNEEFLKEVYELTKEEYIFLDTYKNSSTKLKVIHTICNNTYFVTPNKFLQGRRCPFCKSDKISKALRTSNKDFKEKINKKFNGEYVVLSEYINNHTKVKIKHKKCNNSWEVLPNNILSNKSSCPYCANRYKYTTKEYYDKIKKETNNEYILLSDYINNKTKVKIKHKKCNKEYFVTPYHFNEGNRCPYCFKNNKITLEDIKNNFKYNTSYILLEDTVYTGYKDRCLHLKHLKCNNDFIIDYDHFKQHPSCPKCNLSLGEEKIYDFLVSHNIKFIKEFKFPDLYDKDINKPLKFDFKVFLNNTYKLIEFDGKQHFEKSWYDTDEDLKHRQYLDNKKNEYCKLNKIDLLRIPYTKINNIEEILLEELKSND